MNRKILAAAAAVIALTGAVIFITVTAKPDSVNNEEKTLASLAEVCDGVWSMDCYNDYRLDDYLAAGITDVGHFDAWLTENLTHGVPTGDIPDIGCSAFAADTADGSHLVGRNYDMGHDGALVIRTFPENGYSSIGIVDLAHINIGQQRESMMGDEKSKSLLLAAPMCISDGMNEKGLCASLLQLDDMHVVNDTQKPDLLLYSTMRAVLDKCADVDEAIAFVGGYDMYSPNVYTYHLFLADSSGRSVVIEWKDGEMYIVSDTAATNFMLSENNPSLDYDYRHHKLHNRLDGAVLSNSEAMELLSTVKQPYTMWSAVYDTKSLSVDICFEKNYSDVYTFSLEK